MRSKQKFLISGFIALAMALGYLGKSFLVPEESIGSNKDGTLSDLPEDQRIVSLAPSITEILFALEQGDQIAGVTRYCNHPPEARTKAEIGGYFDLNYEAIVALEPTMIILLEEHVKAREYFSGNGYATLAVNHMTLEGIIESIELIGKACGCESSAEELTKSIKREMERVLSPVRGRPQKRTMIAVDRSSPRSLEQIYIAGNDGFFSKLIELAGGVNAYDGTIAFPAISAEGIIQMNPEIIIELVPETTVLRISVDELENDWKTLAGVEAVENNRVFLLTKDYASIPGPRFILTLRDIVDLLHTRGR
jgi:iron complex transport system substrate-binding protein